MKLLIVVSKLLTGFDAPSCTYIYLDNELRDHNLFQAICRTNRLDGDDKDYGHIVDFKELFGEVQEAIAVYSSDELDADAGSGGDHNVHLKDWLSEGRKRLDEAREALRYLCEPVPLPREVEQYLHCFCGDAADPNALNETEALRISFYKAVAVYVRAFAAMAQDLTDAGYPDAEATAIRKEVEFYGETRSAIKKHSGEELDIKPYEADMRHLLNTYVQAEPATDLGELSEMSLIESIIETGIHDAIARKLNEKGKLSSNAIAEGIINNVRKIVVRNQLTDPRFYKQMSKLLDDLIKQSREDAAAYEEFLRKAEALVKWLADRQPEDGVPAALHGRREATAIYNNLIARWEPKLGVDVAGYFLQRMKTRWGGCNHRARTIRLNTELVKKPKDLLEYVVVHEMLHLVEPTHSERFLRLMSKHHPGWREARVELNELPLGASSWNE